MEKALTQGISEGPMSRRGFLALAGAASGGLVLAGLGSNAWASPSNSSKKTVTAAFLMPEDIVVRWKAADWRGFSSEAAKLGMRTYLAFANNSISDQLAQAEEFISRGIDILVVNPVNATASTELVLKAKRAQIPVIAYNFLIEGAPIDAYVAWDAVAMGEKVARFAIQRAPTGNYVLVWGDETTSVAQDEKTGHLKALKPYVASGKIKIVSQQFNGDWSPSDAENQAEEALTKTHNKIAAFVCGNDGMAYGVIQALKRVGLAGKVVVVGVDSGGQSLVDMEKGLLTGSNWGYFDVMGSQAARVAYGAAQRKLPVPTTSISNGAGKIPWYVTPNEMVDKANLAGWIKNHVWYVNATLPKSEAQALLANYGIKA